jgi:tRNA pseudouridine32 synthase/23S rRNA pseudouridine746 synthase
VFDKPSGLLAVPGRGPDKQDCLSARAQAAYPDALVVHRLDMATSGIVVMARGLEAQRTLSTSFEKRRVHKRSWRWPVSCRIRNHTTAGTPSTCR